ncbi:MAG: hypothetical protein DRQ47_04365 [Gammaproteobacteria bacterium]|nr:MAG: hypothetical protein DRQ47_04365 [Gammaproteobacteria bacterium]
MSTTAEDVSASLSSARPGEPTLDQSEQIAALLVGDDEPKSNDDKKDDENPTLESTSDDEESNEEQEATDDDEEETTLEAVKDDDVTWESTLGVSEGDLSFDDDGNIVGFNTKVNGETNTVGAKDLIAGYQNNKSFTAKSQAFADEVKEFSVQKEKVEQLYLSRLASVDALSEHFEKQLISEFDGVDWQQLRTENPAEYAAMRQDFSAKAGELKKIKDAIESDKQDQNQELSKGQQEKAQAYMKGQYDLMIEKNPEWADEPTRTKAREGFKSFVVESYGFTNNEFDTVFDARLIELIKDAKKYRDGAKVAEKKMTKPVPKFQKSRGKGAKPKASKLEKLTAASRSAMGSEKRDLQQSAVAELLLGG